MLRTASYLALLSSLAATTGHAEDNWSGAYVGAFIGGALPDLQTNLLPFNSSGPDVNCNTDVSSCYSALNDLNNVSGISGIRLGYDREINDRWVIGGYGELANVSLSNVTYYTGSDGEVTNSERSELRVNSMVSIRGRLGLDLGDTLAFASAGVSFVDADFATSTSDTDPRMGIASLSKAAPSIGIGVEHMVAENIAIGAAINHVILNYDPQIGGIGDFDTESRIEFKNLTTFDLSLNFRF